MVFCLGAYTGAVLDAQFRKITADYTAEFAGVLRGSSPAQFFVLEREWCVPSTSRRWSRQAHRCRSADS